ncbi:MAG: stage III sporulation protein AG [Firmicutes bacterium HGW-Firmicutes-13]|nr:MAG: stage III sporulation protein AG [Firmicutes bacterium HGW-Firmicutes-13]
MASIWEKLKNKILVVNFNSEGMNKESVKKLADPKLIMLILLGVGLMLFSSFFTSADRGTLLDRETEEVVPAIVQKSSSPGKNMESELEKILNEIEGVSGVSVFLSFYSGSSYVYASNIEENLRQTEERDRDGGTRDIIENNQKGQIVLMRGNQGQEEPLIIEEVYPKVQGVLIVAKGVENPHKQSQVVEAVRAVLNLPSHKVVVLPGGR